MLGKRVLHLSTTSIVLTCTYSNTESQKPLHNLELKTENRVLILVPVKEQGTPTQPTLSTLFSDRCPKLTNSFFDKNPTQPPLQFDAVPTSMTLIIILVIENCFIKDKLSLKMSSYHNHFHT